MDVKDKVIIMTGGANGIGRALAELFAKEGAKFVAIADLDMAGAETVAAGIGTKAKAYKLDVTSTSDVQGMVDDIIDTYGKIDLYFSNAGIMFTDAPDWNVYSQSDAQWQKIWQVNVHAHVIASRIVLPAMIERGDGAFIVTASAAGLLSQIGDTAYSVTKHAALGFAETVAITHGDSGIYAAALCPQAVESNMTKGAEGSSASVDGIMKADELARRTLAQMREGRFMIRPHETVEGYFQLKANNYERWIGGMRKMRRGQIDALGSPI